MLEEVEQEDEMLGKGAAGSTRAGATSFTEVGATGAGWVEQQRQC